MDVENRLHAYGYAIQVLEQPDLENAVYFLLQIDPSAAQVTVKGFRGNQIFQAQEEYLSAEKSIAKDQGRDAVLVSVDSVAALRRAYPNYFADTHIFLDLVRDAIDTYEIEYIT